MTLALLCGSLEPGADGVGDYSRRLAAACNRLGVTTHVVALHDHHMSSPQLARQCADGFSLNTLRLPASLSWRHRALLLNEQLKQWGCTAISLQFVPYAFDRRGLPVGLLRLLRTLHTQRELRVHLMFHEIWIGISSSSDRRSRLIGHLQRRLVQAIHATLRPDAVHVTNSTYACCLRRAGIEAVRLPLFSTLELPPTPPPVCPPSTFTACVFGRIPPPWDPDPALEVVVAEAARRQQTPRLLLVGRPWIDDPWFERLQQRWPQLQIVRHGIEPDSHKLCELIRSCQLGLATVPWGLIEKSSAVSVFLSLELPVLVSRNDWSLSGRWRGKDDPDLPDYSNLYRLSTVRQGLDPAGLPRYQPSTPQHVATVMLAALWPAPADSASLHG